ncbi:MAG TPA: hypothetical protein VGA08_00210 [Candidatus Saccharimonadales bacterium]
MSTILLVALIAAIFVAAGLAFFARRQAGQWQVATTMPNVDTETASAKVRRWSAAMRGAAVATLLLVVLVVFAFATASSADGDPEATTTTISPTTPAVAGSDVCPAGTSDNLRFELDELEHPQALTPAWPEGYEEQTKFLFGPDGVACGNVQILTALAFWLNQEVILGESDGNVQVSSAEWIALLRANGDRRLEVLDSVYDAWQALTLVDIIENEQFDGDIYRFVPPNANELVWDQYDTSEQGFLVGDYTIFRGEEVDPGHLLMSLRHGWALDEDVPIAADLEDNPEVAPPDTTMGNQGDKGGDSGDDRGDGDDDGESGNPGDGGECEGTPTCDGEDPGGGGGDGDGGDDGDDGCGDGCDCDCDTTTTTTTCVCPPTTTTTTTTRPPTTTTTHPPTTTTTTRPPTTTTTSTTTTSTTTTSTTTTTRPPTTTTMPTTTTTCPPGYEPTPGGGCKPPEPSTTVCNFPPCGGGVGVDGTYAIVGDLSSDEGIDPRIFLFLSPFIALMAILIFGLYRATRGGRQLRRQMTVV